MYPYDYWQIAEQIQALQHTVSQLQAENKQLKEQLTTLQPIKIEKMEYKINELVVETLSGTLNIGLSAHTDDSGLQQLIERMKEKERMEFEIGEESSVAEAGNDD